MFLLYTADLLGLIEDMQLYSHIYTDDTRVVVSALVPEQSSNRASQPASPFVCYGVRHVGIKTACQTRNFASYLTLQPVRRVRDLGICMDSDVSVYC